VNLQQIQDEAGRLLSDANHGRWGLDVLTLRANQAQTEIQGYTNAIKTLENIPSVAGTTSYSPNSNTMDIIRIYKVLVSGEVKPFIGINREELDLKYPNWRQWQSGEPLLWVWDATSGTFFCVPTPDTSISSFTIYESRDPSDLVNSTDIPFDSNNQMIPYHYAIVHWIVAQCWMDDGTPEALAKSRFHKSGDIQKPGQYELQLKRIMATFDTPEDVLSQIIYQPQGGRIGTWGTPSKAYPLG
jgi:hypothetical protein